VYVSNSTSNTVSVVNTATNSVIATVPVGTGPQGLAVNPTGTRVYVVNAGAGSVSVINTTTNAVIETILVPGALDIAFNHTGTRAYVAALGVSILDTTSNQVIATLPPLAGRCRTTV
jgi:YVTN family beta-propeller protein